MATFWEQQEGRFESIALEDVASGTKSHAIAQERQHRFRIVSFRNGRRPGFALIAKAETPVLVNGAPVIGGLRILRHKDEMLSGSQRMFFSAEAQPVMQIYEPEESGRPVRCPVCRSELRAGDSIVRCPGCQRAYHQAADAGESAAKRCWTYAAECRFCQHPTSMSGRPSWRPDEDGET